MTLKLWEKKTTKEKNKQKQQLARQTKYLIQKTVKREQEHGKI